MLMFDFLFKFLVRWDNLVNGWRRLWHFQILLLNDLFLFDNWRFVMMMHFSYNCMNGWWWRLWHFMFRFVLLWCRHFIWDVDYDTTFTAQIWENTQKMMSGFKKRLIFFSLRLFTLIVTIIRTIKNYLASADSIRKMIVMTATNI